MSSLIVEVCSIDNISKHENADKLEILHIKGWNVCSQKGTFKVGDKCCYLPPDSIISEELANKLGATKYLSPVSLGKTTKYRVRVANLRGFKSYGMAFPCENPDWPVGFDLVDHFGVEKYEPPVRSTAGDSESPYPAFHTYYHMENIKNFPTLIRNDETVVVTEKIHGENCRLGLIKYIDNAGRAIWKWMAGSHDVRRKRFDQKGKESLYWKCFTPEIRNLLATMSLSGFTPEELDSEPRLKDRLQGNNVIVFCERFGCVQDMKYGFENGEFTTRAFDIAVNGQYLSCPMKFDLFNSYNVPTVPILYNGPFSMEKILELAEEPSSVCPSNATGYFTGREGVVVVTETEQRRTTDKKVFDRTQLKCISFGYSNRRGGTENH